MCFSNELTVHKVIIKSLAQLYHQGVTEQLQHFKTMFHTLVQRVLLGNGE